MSFKRPYHHYVGRPFLWRRGKADLVPVEILPKSEQPPTAPWLFRPTAGGRAIHIDDSDLLQQQRSSRSPSGT